MTVEQTFFIIKPDGVEQGLTHDILKTAKANGLIVKNIRLTNATDELIDNHYAHLKELDFYPSLKQYMLRSPIVIGVFEGKNAVNKWRTLIGHTFPDKADVGTIRNKYGKGFENVVHGSDSVDSAKKEIALWLN